MQGRREKDRPPEFTALSGWFVGVRTFCYSGLFALLYIAEVRSMLLEGVKDRVSIAGNCEVTSVLGGRFGSQITVSRWSDLP